MKLIILDRDGVINEDSERFIKSPDEWIAIPGSLEAIARLCHSDYRVMIATNQSGVERGLFDIETLHKIHAKMHQGVNRIGGVIEGIFFCTSTDDSHPNRKPNPGMLLEIGRRTKFSLTDVAMVGDSIRDIRAARAAGAKPVLVLTGKGRYTLANFAQELEDVEVFDDLAAMVKALLETPV